MGRGDANIATIRLIGTHANVQASARAAQVVNDLKRGTVSSVLGLWHSLC